MTSETGIFSFPESIYDEEPTNNIDVGNNKSRIIQGGAPKRSPQYSTHIMLQHAWQMYALQQLKTMSKTKKSNNIETIVIDDEEETDVDATKTHEKISKKPSEQEPAQLLSQLLGHEGPPCTKDITTSVVNETKTSVPSGEFPKHYVQEDCHKNRSKYGIRYKLYPCEHCDVKFQNIFRYEKHLIRLVFKLMLMTNIPNFIRY